ncbi:MAG: hypothetical protein WBL63_01705 [Candidatus Acidiferrum sp.]
MKLRLVILTVILLAWTAPAFPQACAMCYSSAQATPKDGQRAINKGVIVLLLPPVGFMTLGLWMAQRYARKRDLEQRESEESTASTTYWE